MYFEPSRIRANSILTEVLDQALDDLKERSSNRIARLRDDFDRETHAHVPNDRPKALEFMRKIQLGTLQFRYRPVTIYDDEDSLASSQETVPIL